MTMRDGLRALAVSVVMMTTFLAHAADEPEKKDKGKGKSFWGEVKKGGKFAGKVGDDIGAGAKKIFSSDGKKEDKKKE
jgi:hypothetical protein